MFKILLIISFKIAIVYVSIIKLLSKQTILIANDSDARLLNKISRFLLIIVINVSKVSFYILKIICQIY